MRELRDGVNYASKYYNMYMKWLYGLSTGHAKLKTFAGKTTIRETQWAFVPKSDIRVDFTERVVALKIRWQVHYNPSCFRSWAEQGCVILKRYRSPRQSRPLNLTTVVHKYPPGTETATTWKCPRFAPEHLFPCPLATHPTSTVRPTAVACREQI